MNGDEDRRLSNASSRYSNTGFIPPIHFGSGVYEYANDFMVSHFAFGCHFRIINLVPIVETETEKDLVGKLLVLHRQVR